MYRAMVADEKTGCAQRPEMSSQGAYAEGNAILVNQPHLPHLRQGKSRRHQ